MRLSDLEGYNPVTIQCHDNPDADTLGAGYGLYCYFKSRKKDVHLIYSGKNQIQKANLRLMKEKLHIPAEYLDPDGNRRLAGLLITVDCQYGAGNVTRFTADEVAIIDHHAVEITDVEKSRIQPDLGSCSTLVWRMMQEEGFDFSEQTGLGTALYYGLYTDTNQFSELFHPLDLDMRETVPCNRRLITLFRNSNLSLKELEIAGIAMIRSNYNEDYRFAVIKAQPCDPNILGLISDFLIQVDGIDACVVYNEVNDGYKYSVRSCVREVMASELAGFLAKEIGSGGGHMEKAGGFISRKLYHKAFPNLHSEGYFNNRMKEYFDSFSVIYADETSVDLSEMEIYRRKYEKICYVRLSDIYKPGTEFTLRTKEGDAEIVLDGDMHIILERDGGSLLYSGEQFEKDFCITEEGMPEGYYAKEGYSPTVKEKGGGPVYMLADYGRVCLPDRKSAVYAMPLTKGVKLFTKRDEDKYLAGMPGDYLMVRMDDTRFISVLGKDSFSEKYEQITL